MDQEEIFSRFRPFCSVLATKPSPEILQKLAELVAASDPSHLVAILANFFFLCR
jgi:hypothetical protein